VITYLVKIGNLDINLVFFSFVQLTKAKMIN